MEELQPVVPGKKDFDYWEKHDEVQFCTFCLSRFYCNKQDFWLQNRIVFAILDSPKNRVETKRSIDLLMGRHLKIILEEMSLNSARKP